MIHVFSPSAGVRERTLTLLTVKSPTLKAKNGGDLLCKECSYQVASLSTKREWEPISQRQSF